MDKYEGIKRAQTHSTTIEYQIVKRQSAPKKEQESRENAGFWLLLRCIFCTMVVLICLLGKFTPIGTEVSTLIKDELSRDSIEQLVEYIQDHQE